jgi:hypothetical protein
MAHHWHPSTDDDGEPAPDLSAVKTRHMVRRASVRDMTTRTGSCGPIALNVCAVPSADGMASLLATVLAVSECPATVLLEELAHTEIPIEVISCTDRNLTASEHDRLNADRSLPGSITPGFCASWVASWWRKPNWSYCHSGCPSMPAPPWFERASRSARSWLSSARGGWTVAPCAAGAVRIPLARTWRLSPWQCWRSAIPRSASLPKRSLGHSADLLRSVLRYEPPFYHLQTAHTGGSRVGARPRMAGLILVAACRGRC